MTYVLTRLPVVFDVGLLMTLILSGKVCIMILKLGLISCVKVVNFSVLELVVSVWTVLRLGCYRCNAVLLVNLVTY